MLRTQLTPAERLTEPATVTVAPNWVKVVEGFGVDEAVLVLFDGIASGIVGVGELVTAPRGAVGEGGDGVSELADGVVAVGVNLAVLSDDLGALVSIVEGKGE